MSIELPLNSRNTQITLKNVLHCPDLHTTLLSVAKIDDAGYACRFSDGECRIYDNRDKLLGIAPRINGLYQLVNKIDTAYSSSTPLLSLYDAHIRLGHVNYVYIKHLLKAPDVQGFKLDPSKMEEIQCETCLKAKLSRQPITHSRSSPLATNFGDLVHMDLWGPVKTRTVNHNYYTLSLLDDATYWLEEILLKSKDQAYRAYQQHQAALKTMEGTIIKTLHSDRGGEFLGTEFTNYLKELGTRRKLTTHDTPQHNGQVERAHRTLFDGVRAVLNGSGLPQWLWGYALEYMVYVWNRTPKKAIGMKTPFEMRYKSKPNLSNIHRFGALVYYAKREDNKLVPRGRPGFWIGLELESNRHYIYSTNSRTIAVERDIVFSMHEFSRLEGESEMTWDMEPVSIDTDKSRCHLY